MVYGCGDNRNSRGLLEKSRDTGIYDGTPKFRIPITKPDISGTQANNIQPDQGALERLQAGVARRILKASWKTPKTVLLLRSLQWSSLGWRREIISMTHFHDLLCTRPPHLAASFFPFSRSKRQPRRLMLPLAITVCYKNSFFLWFCHDMEHPPNSFAINRKQVCFLQSS